jgi:glycerate kinase
MLKKIVLTPDSFKGTMSSIEICNIAEESIRSIRPDIEVVKIPIADGGEGTVDAFLTSAGGKKISIKVKDPYFNEIDAYYCILPDGKTAVIEMAAASGLPLVEENKDPRETTTYGTGQLISSALEQ